MRRVGALLARAAACAALLVAGGCGVGLWVSAEPELENLMVELEGCSGTPSCSAGDFTYEGTGSYDPPIVFGGTASDGSGGVKIIPNIELRVNKSALVRSPVDGVISELEKNADSDDYYIWISTSALTEYRIEIDHLTELRVKRRDRVEAGDALGLPGVWSGAQGRVELQLNRGERYLCPLDYLKPGKRSQLESGLLAVLDSWERVKSDNTLYEEAAFVTPGCYAHSYGEDEL